MALPPLRSLRDDPTFVAAITGGVVGLVLMTSHGLMGGSSAYNHLELVFTGSLLAGYLARHNGGRSRSAGIAAAALGVVPTFLSVSTPVGYFLESYGVSGIGAATAVVVLFAAFVLLVAVVTGSLGGAIGGWVESKFSAQPA